MRKPAKVEIVVGDKSFWYRYVLCCNRKGLPVPIQSESLCLRLVKWAVFGFCRSHATRLKQERPSGTAICSMLMIITIVYVKLVAVKLPTQRFHQSRQGPSRDHRCSNCSPCAKASQYCNWHERCIAYVWSRKQVVLPHEFAQAFVSAFLFYTLTTLMTVPESWCR